jgi:hypothetical protein
MEYGMEGLDMTLAQQWRKKRWFSHVVIQRQDFLLQSMPGKVDFASW